MTRVPQRTGDTYADIVSWRWDRNRMRWWTVLRDGTILDVVLQRFGRRSFWNPSINGKALPDNGFKDPTSAQDAAFAAWRKKRKKRPPCKEGDCVIEVAKKQTLYVVTVTDERIGMAYVPDGTEAVRASWSEFKSFFKVDRRPVPRPWAK